MQCKVCNSHMYIIKGEHKIEGDNSPETQTKLFYVQTLECTDPKCKHKETISNEIKLGGGEVNE